MKGTCEQIPFHFFLKFMMLYFAGWSDRRIGEDMGFPRSTVQNRRARALARLADILTEGGDPHGKDKD